MKHGLTFPIDSLAGLASGRAPRIYSLYREKQISRRAPDLPWISTADRLASSLFMSTIAPFWATLSPDDVDAWSQFAKDHTDSTKYGRFTQAGYNWFIRVNWLRQAARLPIQSLPPQHSPNAFIRSVSGVLFNEPPPMLTFSATLASPSTDQCHVQVRASVPWYNPNRRPRSWELKSIVPLSVGSSFSRLKTPGQIQLGFANVHSSYYPPAQVWLSLRVISQDWWPGDENRFLAAIQP